MILAIALIMTFLVGGFTGISVTFYVLATQDETNLEVKLGVHPSTRHLGTETILDYSKS